MTEQEERFADLLTMFKSMAERERMEIDARRKAFFDAIPENTETVYIHLSHTIHPSHLYAREMQEKYGIDNVLVTTAPATSGQSFYDDHLDKTAAEEKRKRIIEPFEKFSKEKSIDVIIYLCNYLCDGYQSPIFPEDVVIDWHIWRPIRLAEQLQKPLIVGYQNRFCFGVECCEREYITNPKKIKCPVKTFEIVGE